MTTTKAPTARTPAPERAPIYVPTIAGHRRADGQLDYTVYINGVKELENARLARTAEFIKTRFIEFHNDCTE